MADTSDIIREFTTDVSLYEKGRPEYSKESVEFLLSCVGALPSENNEATKLLEIAAGTGKFTRVMAEILTENKANVKVIASDSQEAMCDMFRRCVPRIEILRFPAENMGKKGFFPWVKQSGTPLEWAYEGVAIFQYAEYHESIAVHTRAFFKKVYCAHQNRSIARGSVGLGDLHLTYRGVAMIFFARSILPSQFSHIISTSLAHTVVALLLGELDGEA